MAPQAPPAWFNEAIAAPFEKRVLTVSGCEISYLLWGDRAKAPLLLVHGGAAHAMWWSILAPQLSRHYYVIAPDLSGHGDSGRREAYPMQGGRSHGGQRTRRCGNRAGSGGAQHGWAGQHRRRIAVR
jgi:pimeloyl-ACP methyl ester carboxylesterase